MSLALIGELQPCLTILAKDSRGPFEAFTSFQKIGNINQVDKEKGIPCRKKQSMSKLQSMIWTGNYNKFILFQEYIFGEYLGKVIGMCHSPLTWLWQKSNPKPLKERREFIHSYKWKIQG